MIEPASPHDEITPAMLKAAWVEVRRWWPRKVAAMVDCKACGQEKGYRVIETCIRVDEPQPGFREAITAALRACEVATRDEANPNPPQGE